VPDLAGPGGALLWFLLHRVPGLLERLARHCTSHAAVIAGIQRMVAASNPAPPTRGGRWRL
jgi:LuxR family transcriptional regulator, maltose regulon positive regulatory protein